MTENQVAVIQTAAPSSLAVVTLRTPQNFPLVVSPEVEAKVAPRVAAFQLSQITPTEITKLGYDAEMELTKVLDAFLATIDSNSSPAIFGLLDQLNRAVTDERLNELADRIVKGSPPSIGDRIRGLFSSSAAREALNRALAETSRVISAKSKKLLDVVDGLQRQTEGEMRKLEAELTKLDELLKQYGRCHDRFAVEVLYLHNIVEQARVQVAQLEAQPTDNLVRAQAMQKLQALESRALAIEGAMTKLPADQLTLAQLQDAGLSTLQEMATTMTARFSSIKGNLIAMHGAQRVLEVQHLAQKGKALDENTANLRNKLMTQAVTVAANAPGDNRLAQAQQVQSVIQNTQQLVEIAVQAKQANRQKFEQSREILSASRQTMLTLGRSVIENRSAVY